MMRKLIWLICLVALMAGSLSLTAAHGESEGEAHAMDSSTIIRFGARVGEKDFACGITYEGLGAESSAVNVTDFRLYVSNIRLINAAGEEVPLMLKQDGLWQHEGTALLDFEDGAAGCADTGNDALNTKVVGDVPEGEYTGLVFELGVPFELNHLDASVAPSPLNVAAMWWVWQVGYKFVRIDLMADGQPWFIHLGSTDCESADFNTPPESPCGAPNRVEVRFESFNPAHDIVTVDLASVVEGIDLSTSQPEPPGCMSGKDDADCTILFPNLGLSLETGLPDAAVVQKLFRVS
ncbi:MAG: metallo-mystery pair system four-Cys motif protein [Anaerolineae bacterium]|nr:metallo-mystery pair system four-Cys motif protein [Anaerolineae bacterium]